MSTNFLMLFGGQKLHFQTESSQILNADCFIRKNENIYMQKFKVVLELCLFSHSQMMHEDKITNDLEEEVLSNKLNNFLEQNKGLFKLGQYTFVRESAEINKKTSKTKGYTDIRVSIPNPSEFSSGTLSFIIECKIIDSYSRKNKLYIEEGILRFISGKYSENMNVGGMIGFIRIAENRKKSNNSKTDKIIDNINYKLVNDYKRPNSEELAKIHVMDKFDSLFISKHSRTSLSNINLFHMLLDTAVAT